MHKRVHPRFSDELLGWLDTLPRTDPRNDPSLEVDIELALGPTDGSIVAIGVVHTSGVPAFDLAALQAVSQAQPFGQPPSEIRSWDGNVYVHWALRRDPVYACVTSNMRPYIVASP